MSKAMYYTDGKHKVVCVIPVEAKPDSFESVSGKFIGKAFCNPNDKFDLEKGKELAYERALLKLKKAEVANHKYWEAVYANAARIYEQHKNARVYNEQRVKDVKFNLMAMTANPED